jgi:hypothetical protein
VQLKWYRKIKINPTLCNQFSVDGGRNLTMVGEKLTQLNELQYILTREKNHYLGKTHLVQVAKK